MQPIDTDAKKANILAALTKRPMNYAQLARVVGWYKMHALVADLKAERRIYTNQTEQRLEVWR